MSFFAFVLCKLSNLNLNSSRDSDFGQYLQLEMDRRRNEEGFIDLKINIHRLYEIASIGIIDSREATKEVKILVDEVNYFSYQTSNHDARIDDNEMNLREIMGKVDRIQEELQLLVQMNQGSHFQENPREAKHQKEEESVT